MNTSSFLTPLLIVSFICRKVLPDFRTSLLPDVTA